MTLSLSRAAKGLRPPDHQLRLSLLVVGGGCAALAIGAQDLQWLLLPAGIMVGYAFRPEAERYYMEGFGDGVEAGSQLADERQAAGLGRGGEGLQPDAARTIARGTDPDQLAAGAPDPVGRFSQPAAAPGEHRPARPAVTEDGRPIPATGPRAPAFPEVAARGTRSVDLGTQDRAEAGSEVGAGVSETQGG